MNEEYKDISCSKYESTIYISVLWLSTVAYLSDIFSYLKIRLELYAYLNIRFLW